MKKFLTITAAFALVLGLSQCRKPNAPTINGGNGTQHVVLQASLDNGGSKIAENGIGGIEWAVNDQIAVKQGETPLGTLNCTNAESGIFEGTITSTQGKITFTFGTQKFDEQTGTLDGAISLSSGEVTYNPEGSYTNVQMTMPHAVLKLDLSAFGTADGNDVTISAGGSVVASVTGVKGTSTGVYVAMPAAASSEYKFRGGGKTGKATWELAANTFYTKTDGNVGSTGEAIEIIPDVESPKFSVSADKTVEFSKGNLWYGTASSKDAAAFHFESNQWDYANTWNTGHVSHFYWSKTAGVAYAQEYNDPSAADNDVFFADDSGFTVEDQTGWRTLSYDEWGYLLGTRKVTVSGEQKASYGEGRVNGVNGLIILPDDWDGSVCPSFTYGGSEWSNTFTESTSQKWSAMESAGAVFLPAAGYRYGTDVNLVGSRGFYWSGTPNGSNRAYYMNVNSGNVYTYNYRRYYGLCVRLVR